ncbi:MAG: very short patch repair endonuclease [Planctomycetaceae bacterium]|nr:very short patch repair endonuclease [Planctomycetaceae bacterium]
MDVFTPQQRSRVMRAVKSADTTPEMVVRRLVHGMGYRYRLHASDLPGKPDLVLPRHRKAIFVHGCFWHRHRCAAGQSMPASRVEYWQAKFDRNVKRDAANLRKLRREGWSVLVVWECQTKASRLDSLQRRLARFLQP